MQIKTVQLQDYSDDRGSLIALEDQKNVPFQIRRIYYIFNTKDAVSRGFHAHKNLTQMVIAIRGSCRFVLDDGSKRSEIVMNNPAQGVLVESLMWREMHEFSDDCILMVLASSHYDESDYIRNYEQFIESVKQSDSSIK